ncbi:MAG: YlbF family regulator [Eubacteriales bacterium]
MSVIDKAKQLGEEIANSKELKEMREAELMMTKDPEALNIIQNFNEKQRVFRTIQEQGLELTDSQKKEVEDLESRMIENPFIYNFFKSQQTFEKVLEQINNIIGEAIGMGSGCSCDSDDCNTCSCEECH